MGISIFSNYQQQQISVYAQQVVKILRRSDGGKSIKMSFKNVRYSAQKTVSNHLKLSKYLSKRLKKNTSILCKYFDQINSAEFKLHVAFRPRVHECLFVYIPIILFVCYALC